MLNRKLLAFAVITGGLFAGSAGTMAGSAPAMTLGNVQINPAAAVIIYNARIHGMRCRFRGPRCGYYYGGWYYERPWWTIGVGVPGPGVFVYDVRRHGPRYRYRRPGYVYYYGGYYYARPWWSIRVHL